MDIFGPLQWIANGISYDWLGFAPGTYVAEVVNFFIYDSLKIGLLLVGINYLMAIVRYYFPIEKARDILTSRNWYGLEYLLAAMFGVVTPFCSCSSIPLFVGFLSAKIPLGVTLSFLITSPLVNEASLSVFPALFGVKLTLIYNLLGILIGVAGGMIIDKLKMDKFVDPSLLKFTSKKDFEANFEGEKIALKYLIKYWWTDGWLITRKIFPYVLAGVGLGALIHGFVPTNFFETYLSVKKWWTVPLATLLGVPLYANSVGVIPIMEALVEKGVPIGTALAFMTATVTLSIPEAMILKKVMKRQLLAVFFGVTIIGIMAMGYVLNFLVLTN